MTGVGPSILNIKIPRHPSGELCYYFLAYDNEGNWRRTAPESRGPTNRPPLISTIPLWSVTEEKESVLDLKEYLSDGNDPYKDLEISCDSPYVTIDGTLLHALFEEWQEDLVVSISVSDGEDTASTDIVVRIENVNDRPSIVEIISPEDGMTFNEGEKVEFHCVVDDSDKVLGQELEIIWTSDISGEILRYNHTTILPLFSSKLQPGSHVLTISVSDGEFQEQSTVNITIEEEAAFKSFSGIFTVIVIMIAFTLVASYLMNKRRLLRES
jgi:hypothetical protein